VLPSGKLIAAVVIFGFVVHGQQYAPITVLLL